MLLIFATEGIPQLPTQPMPCNLTKHISVPLIAATAMFSSIYGAFYVNDIEIPHPLLYWASLCAAAQICYPFHLRKNNRDRI